MPATDTNTARLSRAVPLDQLRAPETDIREHRPQADVKSLAASMGDPDVGQLQDILVHPVDHDELEDDLDQDALHDLFADGRPLRVVDGETRRLAAEFLGWATLSATIVPQPPDNTVIAQLDANTERIEMGEFETVRALYDHYQETEATLADVGEQTGYSESYLSQVFGLMDAPEWLHDAWRHPEHPLETSHALAVYAMLSSNSIEEYAHAGGLDDQDAYERAVEDGQLMVDVQAEHQLPVGDFRQRCKRCQKETLDQLKDQRSRDEKQADGQTSAATSRASGYEDNTPDPEPCLVCGSMADRKIALDVCKEDYGMLSEMKANDGVLMAQSEAKPTPAPATQDSDGESVEAAQALAQAAGIDPSQAEAVVAQVQEEAQQPREEPHE